MTLNDQKVTSAIMSHISSNMVLPILDAIGHRKLEIAMCICNDSSCQIWSGSVIRTNNLWYFGNYVIAHSYFIEHNYNIN